MAEPLAPPLHESPDIQSRRRYHPPVRCRELGSLSEADQATGAVSPTLLALHSWHQTARPRVERRSPQESQPAQHRVHIASGAIALGWPRHKVERRTHAQSSLLQGAPRRKVRSWCFKKALERSAEETACTGGNQPSIMAEGGPRQIQLALISEKSQLSLRPRGIKPQRKNAGGRKSDQNPFHPYLKPSSAQSAVGSAHQESVSTATKERARTDHQPSQQSSSARNEPSLCG